MGHITCGRCKNTHHSVLEVKQCYGLVAASVPQPPVPAAVTQARRITDKQAKFIRDLGGDMQRAARMSIEQASDYITELKKNRETTKVEAHPAASAPNRKTTKVPIPMLQMVPNGYFAVRPDSTQPYVFFRFSRPKSGQYAGALKIQTQHGEEYKLCMVVWPSGQVTVYDKRWEDELLLVVVDYNGAAITYGQVIGRCMRCRKELTDERSRYYGIGPECETYWPHIIGQIDAVKGVYRPGL